jgi:hypothetical protein
MSNSLQQSSSNLTRPDRPLLLLLAATLATAVGVPLLAGWQVPLWLQPSAVGVLWGVIFLLGLLLSLAGNFRSSQLFVVVLCTLVSGLAFHRITDLTIDESIFAILPLIGCGWSTARFDRSPLHSLNLKARELNSMQVPLLDYFLVTTLVACLAHVLLKMHSPPLILVGVMGTVLIGCCSCWAAYQWALCDHYPIGLPALMSIGLCLAGIAVLLRLTPLSSSELISWMVTGPLSVLAAQVFTVLLVLALSRWHVASVRRTSSQPQRAQVS